MNQRDKLGQIVIIFSFRTKTDEFITLWSLILKHRQNWLLLWKKKKRRRNPTQRTWILQIAELPYISRIMHVLLSNEIQANGTWNTELFDFFFFNVWIMKHVHHRSSQMVAMSYRGKSRWFLCSDANWPSTFFFVSFRVLGKGLRIISTVKLFLLRKE